ncbi:MAG: hypothetical protein ACRDQF_03930 [Thermocrispum sp.]
MIDAAIDAKADLRITEVPSSGGKLIAVLVAGKIGGKAAKGTVMTTDGGSRGRCADSFLFG